MFFRNKRKKQSEEELLYQNRILAAIEDLEQEEVSNIAIAYLCLESKDRELILRFSKALNHILNSYTLKEKIHLEVIARRHYSRISVNFDSVRRIVDHQSFINILIIGSFLSDGYYREDCLLQLQHYENTLPYIILKLNDLVEEIFDSIGAIDKVIDSRRRSKIISEYIYNTIVERHHRNIGHYYFSYKLIISL